MKSLADPHQRVEHPTQRLPMRFSIQRLLYAMAIFAVVIVCFRRASVMSAHAMETMGGPVRISVPAVMLQWLAASLTVGGIAMTAFGRKGLLVGTVLALILIPISLLTIAFILAGNI
ncbi:MAG: hypothetical protein U0905_21180 [Pirellulales bacterium]